MRNKFIQKMLAIAVLVIAACFSASAQTAVTQTTLAGAVTGGGLYNGVANNSLQTTISLTSVTNILSAILGTQPQFVIYVDKEAMGVLSVNTTSKTVGVIRGYMGTAAVPHANAQMVLYGSINTLGANMFNLGDPSGSCTAASTPSTPYINVQTGEQWLCSSVSSTWVPGFNNGGYIAPAVTTAVASAAGLITPSGPLFHITGALAITGFNIPVGFNATALGGGGFCVIPDGTFTTTTANNIALASTAVVNKMICWTWDGTNSKFVPSA